MFTSLIAEWKEIYLESIESTARATMAIGSKSNEHICANTLTIDDHLQPAERWYVAQIAVLLGLFVLLTLQATALALLRIFGAQVSIVAPWKDHLRVRSPCAHYCKDVSRVVTIKLMMIDLADGIERDQRWDVEVARQQQKELVVRTKGVQETEGLLGFVLRGRRDSRQRYGVCFGSGEAEIAKHSSGLSARKRLRG